MRQAVSILLIAVIGFAWANTLSARSSFPPCCKAHHCTMKKQCGIGTAASPTAAKIYTVLCDVLRLTRQEIAFSLSPLAARRPPLAVSKDIDHPPPALFD